MTEQALSGDEEFGQFSDDGVQVQHRSHSIHSSRAFKRSDYVAASRRANFEYFLRFLANDCETKEHSMFIAFLTCEDSSWKGTTEELHLESISSARTSKAFGSSRPSSTRTVLSQSSFVFQTSVMSNDSSFHSDPSVTFLVLY